MASTSSLQFSSQSPSHAELDLQVDVVSCTPFVVETEDAETRDSSSSTSFSGLGSSMTSGSEPNEQNETSTSRLDENQKRYFCQRCLNHRLEYPRKGHKPYCKFANCQCNDCIMVEKRRQLNNQLSQRKLDPNAPRVQPGEKKIRDPKCARCSAHGKKEALRGHKRSSCPFKLCDCERCRLVEDRRMLMARQIKLRRDQQKAKKAQQVVEFIEESVRKTIDLDLLPKMAVKTPMKANKKGKIQRQKTVKHGQQQSSLPDPTQFLKMRLDASEQDENQQNGAPVMPLPIHPLFRHFRAHNGLTPHPLFPFSFMPPSQTVPYPMINPLFTPPQLQSQTPTNVPTPTSASLPSPTTPPKLQQSNNLSPPLTSFNNMVIGTNNVAKAQVELTPLDKIKLLQQQCFGQPIGMSQINNKVQKIEDGKQNMKSVNEPVSPPELVDSARLQKQQELMATVQKQLIMAQQQGIQSPTGVPLNNFVIAPDILRNLSSNPGVSQQTDWRQLMMQQQQAIPSMNSPTQPINGPPDQVTLDTGTFYKLLQMAMSAKQN